MAHTRSGRILRTIHMQWETVIGLEIHAQLATQSKIFSGSATTFGAEPNTQASLIDLGMPGVLPVLNEEAVKMAVKFGLAIDAEIGRKSVFARKNYFYPDLPKGYQISQYELPIVGKGHLDITLEDGTVKRIGITRAHLEEDAGKSLHEDFHGMSGIDLNRAGTPLLEIVSEPDIRSAKEAVAYVKAIHALVRYLGICDGNMNEGSLRCDCNVSVRPKGQAEFGTRAEIKNVNSFRFIEKAINHEIQRQIELIEDGGKVIQETRLYDPNKDQTRSMRGKEEANDYRYFPDPDLLPVVVEQDFLDNVRATLPELPQQKRERFQAEFGLSAYDASVLSASREMADYFEQVAGICGDAKLAANWVMVELASLLNKSDLEIEQSPVSAEQLGGMILRIKDNTISGKIAKMVFEAMANGEGTADQIIEAKGLKQVTDSGAIESMLDEVLAANAEQVEQYRASDEAKRGKMFGFFVGQAMKASKGKANPQQVNELLKKKLEG
ncbi:aspartyl/glutamyl-tRNA amidotransferase subunit B [Pseudomonas indica]|nr:aspartyl/glutamyl-tRNA amidotransferase subunit B [Pseudomonas indica]